MRITITANSAWNILNFRRELVEALLERGAEVTVLTPPDDSVPELEKMGCVFEDLQMRPGSGNPLPEIVFMFRLRQMLRKKQRAGHGPDAILTYTIKNNIWTAIAARPIGIPCVPNVSGLGRAFSSGRRMEKVAHILYRNALRGLSVVFFQNPDDKALFLTNNLLRPEQARLLPGSGVDLSHFDQKPMPEDTAGGEIRLLMVARILFDKGVREFVEAARCLRASHPNLKFQLLGPPDTGHNASIPMSEVSSWVEEGVIEYLGETEDVRPHLANAHVVVLPSYREGLPRSLIEAASVGRPIIASDAPGCREVVAEGQNGFLCAVRDANDLANTCQRFADLTPLERAEMGQNSRQMAVERFDVKHVIRAYCDALSDLGLPIQLDPT